MNLLKNKRKLSGGALTFAMFFALIVSMGIPGKVYAEGSVSIDDTTPMEYKVTQEGVTPSNGAVEWSKQGDVVTIKLKGNLLGMITIDEGGSYIFDANRYVIFPGVAGNGRQNNAIDGNWMLNEDYTLILKGDGKYYPGNDNTIYDLSFFGKKIYVENGMFIFAEENSSGPSLSVNKAGDANVSVAYYLNDGTWNIPTISSYTDGHAESSYSSGSNPCKRYVVKQGAIEDNDKNGLINMPDPLYIRYYPNPAQSSNPGDSGQGGQNPSEQPSNPTNPGGNTTTDVSGTNYHSDETVVVIITEGEKYVKNVLAQLEKAPVNGKVIIDTKDWYCFNRTLAEKVTSMKEVDVTVKYGYQGKKYEVTIPAGSDIVSLLDENGFVGFRYLDAVFGGRKITE